MLVAYRDCRFGVLFVLFCWLWVTVDACFLCGPVRLHFRICLCAMDQAVCRRPVTMEARVRFPVSPCEICNGQSGIGSGVSSECLIFPRQYHPTIATYSSVCTCCSHQKDKRATPDKQFSFERKKEGISKTVPSFFFFVCIVVSFKGRLLFVCLVFSSLTFSYRLFPCMAEQFAGKLDQRLTLLMYLGSAWFIVPSGHPSSPFLWISSIFLG